MDRGSEINDGLKALVYLAAANGNGFQSQSIGRLSIQIGSSL
jgi:hypothetical protein